MGAQSIYGQVEATPVFKHSQMGGTVFNGCSLHPSTHSLNVPNNVHESWVCLERLKDLSLVEERVDQMWVVLESMRQTRVDNLKNHQQDLLHNGLISCLATESNDTIKQLRDFPL